MKYTDLIDTDDFFRNMRRTPWLKLFPHWWDEKDPLLNAIGDEVERIKASALFGLLNATIHPPVLIWQESLPHKVYNVNKNITQLPSTIDIDAPLYKSWGNIILTNNTADEIDGIEITFDELHGFAINQLIAQGDIIKINLTENKVQLNGETIKPQKIGKGMPYFITSRNNKTYQEGTPLHNEVIRLKINTDTNLEDTTITDTINITEKLENWTINGDTVIYNTQGADPWIQINNGNIKYNLDFSNISDISFWYKGDNSTLSCHANGDLIHSIQTENIKINNITTGKYGTYAFNIENISNNIKITDELINANPKIKLSNTHFNISTYILQLSILNNNNKIIDTLEVTLSPNEWVDIPLENFKNYIISNDARISIHHTIPIIQKNTNNTWTNYTIQTENLAHNGTLEFHNLGENPIYINDIKCTKQSIYNTKCDIDIDINIENAVFINEQNIEVTGLELIPIERVELYANYDFDFNQERNGWQKVYEKKYDTNTNVIYDMITTHFYTKEFYVDVWFKTLQYPYRVGFPCYKDAEDNSMFHVNSRLDTWGEQLGLQRRLYKTNIAEEDYYKTYPVFYPFDIEQDYYYYKRLVNEYTWNDLAINNVDIKDTDGNDVFRLYSISPFCDDFVVHAQSRYPTDKEFIDYNEYYPVLIKQEGVIGHAISSQYNHITNLLGHNNNTSSITLNNKTDNNDVIYKTDNLHRFDNIYGDSWVIHGDYSHNANAITSNGHVSTDLLTYFDLTNLPENVNIDDIKIIIEGESTDNKTNKFNTDRTGLIVPGLHPNEEDTFIPLTADKNYQLNKQSITYSISDSLNKLLETSDENIIQSAIIGNFEGQLDEYIKIPFELKENNEVVNDINEVYIYFNDILKTGRIEEEDGKTYIYSLIPKQAITKELSIICKSETHMPFSTKIDVAQLNHYTEDEDGNKVVDYQYIQGPLVNNQPQTIEIQEEWRTNDIRNILQRQGIYFRNTLINNDEQSSTNIILYNIKLEIHYSQKTSNFQLDTHVNVKDAVKPNIGIYEISITNTGNKPLKTSIDIITPPNIKLEKNYIDVDLNINDTITEYINIAPEYPLIDGFYDILAFCDDVVKKDSVSIFSDGLIATGVTLKPHHGKYNEEITLTATVNAIDNSKIHGPVNQVQFIINGYNVGKPAIVYDNKAQITLIPGNYKFTGTGTLKLEARYLGNTKYTSSIGHSTIFISKNSTRITITAPDKAIYKGAYEAVATVEYFDGEQYQPVNDGHVTFYLKQLNDKTDSTEILSSNAVSNYITGEFKSAINSLENPPGDYTLIARYEGSNTFASGEEEKNFEIIGGEVNVLFFDIEAKPHDIVSLAAKVVDKNNKPIPYGYLDFKNEELDINYTNININNGIGRTPEFEINALLNDDDATKIYNIEVTYHGALNTQDEAYNDSVSIGYITLKKADVIIEYASTYQASQYEPMGFIVKVKDAKTKEYVSDGVITITLPQQNNLSFSAEVDKNGTARLVHNLINFTAKEWFELLKWSFSTNNDNSLNQINIINNSNISNYDGRYNPDNLYKIYDGDYSDITLIDFELENGNLIYKGLQRNDDDNINIEEYVFIDDNGYLYARTDIDEIRQYATGLQNIIINYSSSYKYKSSNVNVENGLNIEAQTTDLDIHSYDLNYTDTDSIICYVTEYDVNNINQPVNDGQVQFIFDNKILDTVDISNGKAILNNELLTSVSAGIHLLEVDYINNDKKTTRSFSLFNLKQATPTINIDIDRVVRNRNSQIIVSVQTEQNNNIPLNGIISLYLKDNINNTITKISDQYLYGNEILTGIVDEAIINNNTYINDLPHVLFNYVMPDDVDTPNKYTLEAIYEGNEFFTSSKPVTLDIQETPSNITINSDDIDISNNIDVAINEECSIDFNITSSDDIINEGVLYLLEGTKIVAQSHVINNNATLSWIPTVTSYELKYTDAIHYNDKQITLHFNIIDAIDNIEFPNVKYKTFKQALMCLKSNGTITINDDIYLYKSLKLNKDCYIIGVNDVCIINDSDKNIDIINLNKTHINNIHFVSKDNTINIINNNYLVINHSILDANIQLHNNDYLMAQRNFIYGTCSGQNADLNNNWWGSNTPKYDVDNHIIITVEPENSPAVISEHLNIVGKMVGANGREYDIPEAYFTFGADTGYFSINNGKTANHQIQTNYLDAEKEGYIYFTVDNETVTCPVYSYDYKTEVIIDDITDIPIGYQIPITARVQSVADIFYDFNDENDVIKSTNTINQGYISFFINDSQIGYVPVENGEATTIVYFTSKYYTDTEYILKAVYIPDTYYFASESSQNVTLIHDSNVCYVSQLSGDDANDGAYNTPIATINHAVSLNKEVIYLLDDYFNESNIDITNNTIIKSFKNSVEFNSISDDIFNIQNGMLLSLYNIDFKNNQSTIFNNDGTLKLNKCILYNNNRLFNNTGEIDAIYSVIVDNNIIDNNIDGSWFTYCWFGSNNPQIPNIDNYVQMNTTMSKDIIYIGTLAHVTGLLDTYKHGILNYPLEEKLPLRIAQFATTYGSAKPIKDYTYNNKSTSLINTQELNNTKQYIISIPDNTNYVNNKVSLQCHVTDVYDNNAVGNVKMNISGNNTNIYLDGTLKNGTSEVEIDRLGVGTYTLTCVYIDKDNLKYTAMKDFIVKKPDLVVKKFNIIGNDNLYNATLDIEIEDIFGNKVDNQLLNVNINNKYITTLNIKNGIAYEKITYDKMPEGQYNITLDNKDTNSEYDTFIAYNKLNIIPKNTKIIFNYTKFESQVKNNINIKIIDNQGNNVDGGYINVELNNQRIFSNLDVINGNVNIDNFIIDEIGQHSIAIYYTGYDKYYNECVFVDSNIGVGIFNVNFGLNSNQYINTDIGKPFNLSTTITDISGQLINHGYVNIYIDDIIFNEEPIYVNQGVINISKDLPNNIISGTYTLRLEYIDTSGLYLDTFLSTYLVIGKIPAHINMDIIYGAPGQKTTVNYQISTAYGNANSGILTAKYNDNIIGQSIVTENLNNEIVLQIPFVPNTNNYTIVFEYNDDSIYGSDEIENELIIQKNNVHIEPSHSWYYPNQLFHFVTTITDNDGNRVNTGQATLYIDNVKETESQDVINGQFTIPLSFSKAKEYLMTIVYEDNEYYEKTSYSFTFKIDSVDIDNLYITNIPISQYQTYYIDNDELYSLPNQIISCELGFDTLDNYNVKDGIVDISIDGNKINSYYIAESNKFIDFEINNLSKGLHTLLLKYYGSSLFNNIEKEIPLHILSKQMFIEINDNDTTINVHNHNDVIDINTVLYDASSQEPVSVTGLIRYYIGLPVYTGGITNNEMEIDYDYRFIGIEEINNNSIQTYQYKLPSNLLEYAVDKYETLYKIKVEFAGNDEYDETSKEIDLQISKQDCNITFDINSEFLEANYRDTIDIDFNIDAKGTPLVNFYIDDELIGSTLAENNQGSFSYKLNSKYTVKEGSNYYLIRASFAGSAIDRPTDSVIKMHVHPLMPKMNMTNINAYYGGVIKLDNIITDIDGTYINDGTLTYTINNDNYTYSLNQPASLQIPHEINDNFILSVEYNTTNSNYATFNKEINVTLKPNDIKINANINQPIYRGKEYNITITATSDTTTLPINLIFNDSYEMEDGYLELPITIPYTEPYELLYNFTIASLGNQFFNPISKDINIEIANYNNVTLNIDQPESATNAHTLTKAIDLVAQYGTIKVIKAPDNQEITIDKSVNIEGSTTLNNYKITNEAREVFINGVTFNNNTSKAIINNGELLLSECNFTNGNSNLIENNNNISIFKCAFNDNNTHNDSCIYVSNKNDKTIISECIFNHNNTSGNCSCIYSNKGNDIEISDNVFSNNDGQDGITTSICVNGNIIISSNSFYNNSYEAEIYLLDGTLSVNHNLFDGLIQSIKAYKGNIDADFNYWGYNNIENIESNNSALIVFDNWLISSRYDYNKQINDKTENIVVGVIDKYINRFEKEIITFNPIQREFPVTIQSNRFNINDKITLNPQVKIKIGQQELQKNMLL